MCVCVCVFINTYIYKHASIHPYKNELDMQNIHYGIFSYFSKGRLAYLFILTLCLR